MKDRRKSDIENTEQLPLMEDGPVEKDFTGRLLSWSFKAGLFLAIVILVTLLSRFLYIRIYGQPLSLIDDTKLVFSGHNGSGKADAMFHPENTALNRLQKERETLKKQNKDTRDIDTLIASIGCQFDYKDHLSNGMNVTYTCDYDASAAKKAGYHIIHDVRSYMVMGLSDAVPIDPFKDLETDWDTGSGSPVLTITPSAENQNLFTYSYTYKGHSKAVIHARPNAEKLAENGYTAEKLTKTITLAPQPVRIPAEEALSEKQITDLQNQAVSSVQNQLSACESYADNRRSLLSRQVSVLSWTRNADGTCTAVLQVTDIYEDGTSSFTLCCQGVIWRRHDGSISFTPLNEDACAFLNPGGSVLNK